MVSYFSGTGNSRYAAELISMVTGDDLISMNQLLKENNKETLVSEKPFIFVTPVYAGRIPRVIDKYIKETNFEGNKKVSFVVTCAETPWNTVSYTEKLCKEKGFDLIGFNSVVMPQNYIVGAEIKSNEENEEIINKAALKIRQIAELIKADKPLFKEDPGKEMMSKVLNPIMYAFIARAKRFSAMKICVGCGECVERCPLNNIKMVNGKPKWGKECTHCMACIGGCPCKAIEYGKKTQDKSRYYNTKKPQI